MAADLAFKLRAFVAIIVIEIDVRGIAHSAGCVRWNFGRVGPLLNRAKRVAVVGLILSQKELIVFNRLSRLFRLRFS